MKARAKESDTIIRDVEIHEKRELEKMLSEFKNKLKSENKMSKIKHLMDKMSYS